MKNIIYFGGYFNSERSMERSFIDNEVKLVFPLEEKWYNTYLLNIPSFSKPLCSEHVFIAGNDKAYESLFNKYKPNAVIQRLYCNEQVMHCNLGYVCIRLGIPYYPYRIETWPLEKVAVPECYAFLYAHKCDEPYMTHLKMKKIHYPYGVSGLEYNMHIKKVYDVATFGFGRLNFKTRYDNINMYCTALYNIKIPLNVFWDDIDKDIFINNIPLIPTGGEVVEKYFEKQGRDYKGHSVLIPKFRLIPGMVPNLEYLDNIIFNKQFNSNDTTCIINKAKIVLNVETTYNIKEVHSYKLYQSMACGVPTITTYKEGIEKDFGPNWENVVYISTIKEIEDAVIRLLNDESLYNKISKNCERFVHDKFDWFKNFDKIAKEEEIW